jgi:subtilisin
MRRLATVLLALVVAAPIGSILGTGTALAAATGPALTPAALDGSEPVRAGTLDASDRWIVVLRDGAAPSAATTHAMALGVRTDRTFNGTVKGYSARLTSGQLAALRADPHVASVVPDGIISLTGQTQPTGVRRVFGPLNPIAKIDGKDERVDADVAIVDTGIDRTHPDLNVVGGVNCSTTNRAAWYDSNGHGTHVAGIVGALDNGIGVVGVAPGVRLWSVRILDPAGNGLISWYVCGLDWITAQRDPADPTRPLFEAANMSVAKPGTDDHNCGLTNHDLMHQAVCRLVASGVTVVAAAGNNSFNASRLIPASYDEVITVSALADTDGRPGGLGGNACYSWNSYDKDDTFADFSNYGADVDLIAPGKCILSTLPNNSYGTMSGTSMAAPLVTGAAALYKASRPLVTPAQVKAALQAMGNLDWNTATDPDPYHEKLLDVSWIVNLGDFAMRSAVTPPVVSAAGATVDLPMNVVRAEDFALPVDLTVTADAPLTAQLSVTHLEPADSGAIAIAITVPPATPNGTYAVTVTASDGTRQRSATVRITADSTPPVASPAIIGAVTGVSMGTSTFRGYASWVAATDAFGMVNGYQAQWSVDGGAWGGTTATAASVRLTTRTFVVGHRYAVRVRARDAAGNWSAWAATAALSSALVQDRSPALRYSGAWYRAYATSASGGTTLYTVASGASARFVFSGRGFALVVPLGPTRGRFQVSVDGVRVATLDAHAAYGVARRVIFLKSGLASRQHTVGIVALGTAGHSRVDIDAFIVLR